MSKFLLVAAVVVAGTAANGGVAAETGSSHTRLANFQLESATLTGIRQKLGKAEIVKSGDGGEYKERLCYVVKHGSISFLASEIGGQDQLSGFELSGRTDPQCKPWPTSNAQPPLELSKVHIGMSEGQFQQLFSNAKRLNDGC